MDVQTVIIKEDQMPQNAQSTLAIIYENWRVYQDKLRTCIVPLTNEHLMLQPAPGMWSIGQIVQHIISARAVWFSGTLQDPDDAMQMYMRWGHHHSPARSAVELVRGLEETWTFIDTRVRRWTPEEYAQTFPNEVAGHVYATSRSWVISHILEHDLHHGGEVSVILGMHGLRAPRL